MQSHQSPCPLPFRAHLLQSCHPTEVYTQAQTWHRPYWQQWDTHAHVTLTTTTSPGLAPSKPKPQLRRMTKILRGIMNHQKLRIRGLLLIKKEVQT